MSGIKTEFLITIVLAVLLLTGCETADNNQPGRIEIFVSILPQKYFAERIGGDLLNVNVMVGPGQSPHIYEPTPRQMASLAEADIYFSLGVPFEKHLLEKISKSNDDLVMVNTVEGLSLRKMTSLHPDYDDGHHGAAGNDPHSWLDPTLAVIQAEAMRNALIEMAPKYKVQFETDFESLKNDLETTDSILAEKLRPYKGMKLYVFHPAFGYFADRYGLIQTPVEIEGKEPSAQRLAELMEKARSDNVKVIFVQPQFSSSSAYMIAESIGAAVIPIDPLAYDYLENLEKIADRISEALGTNE